MITAFELAGLFAAHSVWCVSDGDLFNPLLGYTDQDNETLMQRLVHDDPGSAVEYGRQQLASNDVDATDAVLIFDGRIPIEDEKIDALIIEIRAYFSPDSKAVVAIPYIPKDTGKFQIHKPKVLAWENCEDFDIRTALESFFKGVFQHEEGSKVWEQYIDESK